MNKEDKKRFSVLIGSFFGMKYSSKVQTRFYAWLLGKDQRDEKERAMLEKFESYDILPDENVQRSLFEVHKKLEFTERRSQIEKTKRRLVRHSFLRVAAVVVPVIILAGAGFYFSKNSAVYQIEYQTVVAQMNEKQYVRLPDSSQVWVNSESKVKYATDNNQNQRLVELSGEAYFVVEKDIHKPFIVKTGYLSVTVTGTEFDVKEVQGSDKTVVTLTHGNINVETENKGFYSLVAGQQLTYYHLTGKTDISALDIPSVEKTVIWKNDRLRFEDMTLEDMLSSIEVYFNVTIDSSELNMMDNKLYTIRFSPGEDLNSTMEILKQFVGGFNYRVEGQIVYIANN